MATVLSEPTLSLQLMPATVAVLRLLAEGALAPLSSFMGEAEYRSAVSDERSFPVPVVLPVDEPARYAAGNLVLLRDEQNRILGRLRVTEVFALDPSLREETLPCPEPGQTHALSGILEQVRVPPAPALHASIAPGPAAVRALLAQQHPRHILAILGDPGEATATWQHIRSLAVELDAFLLFLLPGGALRVDDFERYHHLYRLAQAAAAACPRGFTIVESGLPCAGGRLSSLLLQALLCHHYGAQTVLLPPSPVAGLDVQRFAAECERRYGMKAGVLEGQPADARGPDAYAPRGCCIWLTGLSAAGKSSIAERLVLRLMRAGRRATLLDGDMVRMHLSRGLTFSPEDRHTNICRIGYVAAEIVRHGGIAVCAAVSPYARSRQAVRRMMPRDTFLEVFVDTPLEVCERRDLKALYAQARSGSLPGLTGVGDVYERPAQPEVHLRDETASPEANAAAIFDYLVAHRLLREPL